MKRYEHEHFPVKGYTFRQRYSSESETRFSPSDMLSRKQKCANCGTTILPKSGVEVAATMSILLVGVLMVVVVCLSRNSDYFPIVPLVPFIVVANVFAYHLPKFLLLMIPWQNSETASPMARRIHRCCSKLCAPSLNNIITFGLMIITWLLMK